MEDPTRTWTRRQFVTKDVGHTSHALSIPYASTPLCDVHEPQRRTKSPPENGGKYCVQVREIAWNFVALAHIGLSDKGQPFLTCPGNCTNALSNCGVTFIWQSPLERSLRDTSHLILRSISAHTSAPQSTVSAWVFRSLVENNHSWGNPMCADCPYHPPSKLKISHRCIHRRVRR